MNRWTQIGVAAGVVVVAVVLFVVLRPDDDEETDATPAAQTTTSEETTTEDGTTDETNTEDTTTEEAPPTTTTEAGPQRLVVRVDESGLPVDGVQRFDVEKDSRVVLVVRSEVSDHMHLHGYNFIADVAPGSPGRITFRADKTGRFDLELEDRVELIAELRVR